MTEIQKPYDLKGRSLLKKVILPKQNSKDLLILQLH